jgi:hypothetical protein
MPRRRCRPATCWPGPNSGPLVPWVSGSRRARADWHGVPMLFGQLEAEGLVQRDRSGGIRILDEARLMSLMTVAPPDGAPPQ